MDVRERAARGGIKLWADGIPELEANSKGAAKRANLSRELFTSSSVVLLLSSFGVGAAALGVDIATYTTTGVVSYGSAAVAGAGLAAGAAAGVHAIRAERETQLKMNPVLRTSEGLKAFESVHSEITKARQEYSTSRMDDLRTFGGTTARLNAALLQEARLHKDYYEAELKFIAEQRPTLKKIIADGICIESAAQNYNSNKRQVEAVDQFNTIKGTNPKDAKAAGAAR